MNPNAQMTKVEADQYIEQFKRNLDKVLSVSKEDVLKAEARAKKKRAKARR
jgi:hypothetical protein